MANFLKQMGTPAVTHAISEFEERPRREQAFQTQQALSQTQLKMHQMQLQQQEEKEKFLNSNTWNPKLEFKQMGLDDIYADEYINMLKKSGMVDPNTGIGTQKNHIRALEQLQQNSQAFKLFGERMLSGMEMELEKETKKLDSIKEKGANQIEIDTQQRKVDTLEKNYRNRMDKFQGNYKMSLENEKAKKILQELNKSNPELIKSVHPDVMRYVIPFLRSGQSKFALDLIMVDIKEQARMKRELEVEREKAAIKPPKEFAPSNLEKYIQKRKELLSQGKKPNDPEVMSYTNAINKLGYIKPEAEGKETPDANHFSKALQDARRTEQTPLFMEKLSEAEQQRSENRLRMKTEKNYLARGGNPKLFGQFWTNEKTYGQGNLHNLPKEDLGVIDAQDIATLKEYSNPDSALSHVERAYRANMINGDARDKAMDLINKNRKNWEKFRVQP